MVLNQADPNVVEVSRAEGRSAVVLVCEHASSRIPESLNDLGVSPAARFSHVAWDPGALAVAQKISQELDAVLVASTVSRLVYDCNRPPHAANAMPARSEIYDVPGNRDLSDEEKSARVARYYTPFCETLASVTARHADPVIVTIHSFTPVYDGKARDVEIGILHDVDTRFADALLDVAQGYDVRRNSPYGPDDGVTHTLKEHAINHGHLNAMIEVRNDLIADDASQAAMALTLTDWIRRAVETVRADRCKA